MLTVILYIMVTLLTHPLSVCPSFPPPSAHGLFLASWDHRPSKLPASNSLSQALLLWGSRLTRCLLESPCIMQMWEVGSWSHFHATRPQHESFHPGEDGGAVSRMVQYLMGAIKGSGYCRMRPSESVQRGQQRQCGSHTLDGTLSCCEVDGPPTLLP